MCNLVPGLNNDSQQIMGVYTSGIITVDRSETVTVGNCASLCGINRQAVCRDKLSRYVHSEPCYLSQSGVLLTTAIFVLLHTVTVS